MALTTTISPKEFERIAQSAYEGKRIRVSLAKVTTQNFTSTSTVANWDTIKISGNGYEDFFDNIEVGAYDSTDARYEMGGAVGANTYIDALFNASGSGYDFNRVYIVIGTPSVVNISNTALASNVATITTSSAHGFTASDVVTIAGATNSVFNGTYTIVSAPTTTTFTYAKTNADITSASSTGTATVTDEELYLHSLLTESPNVSLAPGTTITYRIQLAVDD